MPIHFEDLEVGAKVAGVRSALIVPCNMCPAVTVAVREDKPFLRVFRNFLKSAPFEQYIRALQTELGGMGVATKVFESPIPHQWFLCMWTSAKRKKLQERAKGYGAVIVLGCESATETVREAVKGISCKVIEGMETAGIMNARLALRWPDRITFENCRTVPFSEQAKGGGMSAWIGSAGREKRVLSSSQVS